jgi:hypothetical protein
VLRGNPEVRRQHHHLLSFFVCGLATGREHVIEALTEANEAGDTPFLRLTTSRRIGKRLRVSVVAADGHVIGYTRFRTCQISTETVSQATVPPMSTIPVL